MKESALRSQVSLIIRRFPGDVCNHEDKFQRGVSDTSYSFICGHAYPGWIECKVVTRWPKLTSTPIRVSFRKEQVIWIRRRIKHGSSVFLLTAVMDEIFIHPGTLVRSLKEGLCQQKFKELSLHSWWKKINSASLKDVLMNHSFSGSRNPQLR